MSDMRSMSRTFIKEFIELYRSHPCLWRVKCTDYTNRNKRNRAYKELIDKLKEVDSDASKDSVAKKINTLRGCYRKEYKKVLNSLKSGAEPEDVYHPSLWYYDLLTFVQDQDPENPRISISNIESGEDNKDNIKVEESLILPEEHPSPPQATITPCGSNLNSTTKSFNYSEVDHDLQHFSDLPDDGEESMDIPSPISIEYVTSAPQSSHNAASSLRPNKRMRSSPDDLVGVTLNGSSEKEDGWDDEFDLLGKIIASKLRRFPRDARIFSEKLLNDVLYQAQLGRLNENSMVVTNHNYVPNP